MSINRGVREISVFIQDSSVFHLHFPDLSFLFWCPLILPVFSVFSLRHHHFFLFFFFCWCSVILHKFHFLVHSKNSGVLYIFLSKISYDTHSISVSCLLSTTSFIFLAAPTRTWIIRIDFLSPIAGNLPTLHLPYRQLCRSCIQIQLQTNILHKIRIF